MNFTDTISFKKNYPAWVLFNFIVLAAAGVCLRCMHCFSLPTINYQFLLHAHSHFAFAGWMFLAIILLFFREFKRDNLLLKAQFNQIFVLTMLVGFGMLISFYLTGYKAVSITLSTLFIFVGYWFAFVVSKGETFKKSAHKISNVLLKGALIFLVISSIGPFSLGYLKSTGVHNLALQQNAIYFYLHFQLNGFMQLALLGLFFKAYLKHNSKSNKNAVVWTKLLVLSTLPLYAMFTLWAKPPVWVYVLVFVSALLHFVAWIVLLFKLKADLKPLSFLVKIAFIAISLQFFFQILIAIPAIGNWAFASRNLIVGYIHLLTLGSLSPLIIDLFTEAGFLKLSQKINYFFVIATLMYLVLLFGSTFLTLFQIYISNLELYLLATNLLFPIVGLCYFINATHFKNQKVNFDILVTNSTNI
nr:hypothetical protein [uncultured Pedobacter sp.]